jgi:hypothetical protein
MTPLEKKANLPAKKTKQNFALPNSENTFIPHLAFSKIYSTKTETPAVKGQAILFVGYLSEFAIVSFLAAM